MFLNQLENAYIKLNLRTRQAIESFIQHYMDADFSCYLVGGSLRDLFLGMTPYDFDFATNAPFEVTKSLFPKVFATGEKHGTLSVLWQGLLFEVTRFRKDIDTDGRNATVAYSAYITDDLERRDFTVNAFAYNPVSHQVVDTQKAEQAFQQKQLVFVGDTKQRILEDHLRALRFIRFLYQLKPYDFTYDKNDLDIVTKTFTNARLSIERIYNECKKIFILPIDTKGIDFLAQSFSDMLLFSQFLPEAKQRRAILYRVFEVKSFFPLWWEIMKKTKLKEVAALCKLTKKEAKCLTIMEKMQNNVWSDQFALKRLLFFSQDIEIALISQAVVAIFNETIEAELQAIITSKEPFLLEHLAICGADLQEIGKQGKLIGIILNDLLLEVSQAPEKNTRDTLLYLAQKK